MFQKIAFTDWVAAALAVGGLLAHVRGYAATRVSGGEVISGYGSLLVVAGIIVACRPYMRAGIGQLVEQGMPKHPAGIFHSAPVQRDYEEAVRTERPKVIRNVWSERVIAVLVVIVGTVLNGYGPAISRLMYMRGS